MIQTLKTPSMLDITGPDGTIYVGGSQEWYAEGRRRMSGCGPTAASLLMWYLARTRPGLETLCDVNAGDVASFTRLMDEMFAHVTPGVGGVNSATRFVRGAVEYGDAHGVKLESRVLEIPRAPFARPAPKAMCSFISDALRADLPVAFLNLSNGTLRDLESWHWVVIIALDDAMLATMCDAGKAQVINLPVWLETTVLGGAMVCIRPKA